MNVWVLLYICFAPVIGIGFFLFFNREALKRKWWLYKHPQFVYKAKIIYPNKMFVETFVYTSKENFEYESATYNIKQEAIIRKNWFGVRGNRNIEIDSNNCCTFDNVAPVSAQLIGELHYVFDFPDPIIYQDATSIITNITKKENLASPLRTAGEQNRVEKNSVLDQLITAEFKKFTLMIIIILLVFIGLISAYDLALRLEIIKQPLHTICVNVGDAIAK